MHAGSSELISSLGRLSLSASPCATVGSWLSYYGNESAPWALHLLTVARVTGEEKQQSKLLNF